MYFPVFTIPYSFPIPRETSPYKQHMGTKLGTVRRLEEFKSRLAKGRSSEGDIGHQSPFRFSSGSSHDRVRIDSGTTRFHRDTSLPRSVELRFATYCGSAGLLKSCELSISGPELFCMLLQVQPDGRNCLSLSEQFRVLDDLV